MTNKKPTLHFCTLYFILDCTSNHNPWSQTIWRKLFCKWSQPQLLLPGTILNYLIHSQTCTVIAMCDRARLRLVQFVLTQHTAFRYFSQALLQCRGFSVLFFRPYNFTIVSTMRRNHCGHTLRTQKKGRDSERQASKNGCWSENVVWKWRHQESKINMICTLAEWLFRQLCRLWSVELIHS